MCPLSSTRVIPERWSEHHQPVAEGAMTARCVVTDPARSTPGVFDPETGTTSAPTPYVVYPAPGADGPCRLQQVQSAAQALQAGQQVEYRDYLVTIPADAPEIHTDYQVRVTAAANDAQAVGATFTVTDVYLGSERFERDLIVTRNQQQGA